MRTPARSSARVPSTGLAQHPAAACSVRHASAMRAGDSAATLLRNVSLGMVWRLSKLTTLSVGTPSAGVSTSSETRPRRVRVRAATTTDPIRPATGSRVSTSTGRSPSGVAANQISPRCIERPVRPVLRRSPLGDVAERLLAPIQRCARPSLRITLRGQPIQVASQRLAEQLRTIDTERRRPALNLSGLAFFDSKAEHRRHTTEDIRMTSISAPFGSQRGLRPPRAGAGRRGHRSWVSGLGGRRGCASCWRARRW